VALCKSSWETYNGLLRCCRWTSDPFLLRINGPGRIQRAQRKATTMKEFEAWWQSKGQAQAIQMGLDPNTAKKVAWDAWRAGREQLYEATAHQRLQPCRS
jgi:hypothetical protein